jgi:anti-sigma regulatory factor (Ser/Thr protein kinase)
VQPHQPPPSNGRPASPAQPADSRSEHDGLRSACRRQAHAIETLDAAMSTLRSGAAALKAEHAELRDARERVCRPGDAGARPSDRVDAGEAFEVSLPLDTRAPGAARIVVDALRGRVPTPALDSARLLVSELVTNSVLHCGAPAGGVVVVRVALTGTTVRLEVRDPGCGGVIAPRAPDREGGGGFGLNLVQRLSERWGLERVAAGGTRVWAQLPDRPADRGGVRFGGREMVFTRQAEQHASGGPALVGAREGGGP